MKKKILSIIAICSLTVMIGVNLSLDSAAIKGFEALITNPEALASGESIHIGPDWCTCKGSVCQDGNYIGFRRTCGSGRSDLGCRDNVCPHN